MLVNVIRVALELLEIERAVIVKSLPSDLVQDGIEVFDLAVFQLRVTRQDFRLGRGQHAIKPAQHRERQHDPLILRRPIRPAQEIRHRPDKIRQLVVVCHCPGAY